MNSEKIIDNDFCYYLEYQKELNLSDDIINIYGYVNSTDRLENLYDISIEGQINLIIQEIQSRNENKDKFTYNLMRIYVSENYDGLENMKRYISSIIDWKSYKKVGVIFIDVPSFVHLESNDDTIFEKNLSWIKKEALNIIFLDSNNKIIFNENSSNYIMFIHELKMFKYMYEFERINLLQKNTLHENLKNRKMTDSEKKNKIVKDIKKVISKYQVTDYYQLDNLLNEENINLEYQDSFIEDITLFCKGNNILIYQSL